MEVNKVNSKPEKRKKSFVESMHHYVKNYAKKCRYSFNFSGK